MYLLCEFIQINGEFTQGENIADNGGVRAAFEAYKDWKKHHTDWTLPGLQFTNEQLFFLTSAHVFCTKQTLADLRNQLVTDPHSSVPFRTNVMLQNLEQFSDVWRCRKGSAMNPEKKCRVW